MTKTSSNVTIYILICLMTILNFIYWTWNNSQPPSSRMPQLLEEKRQELAFARMKEQSKRQVAERKRVLASVQHENKYDDLYGSLAPEVMCSEKVRVGTIGDGGKWTCNPWNTPKDSIMFSFGLRDFIGFETEWQQMLSNRSIIYAFDSAEQSEDTKNLLSTIRGYPKKALIAAESRPEAGEFTIIELAKELNISSIETLKIDIEGAEKTCLVPFLEAFQVCQIFIEMHGGAHEHAALLRSIGHLEFRLFSYEVNGYSMSACEYSFIHEKCIDKYGAHRIANFLDFTD